MVSRQHVVRLSSARDNQLAGDIKMVQKPRKIKTFRGFLCPKGLIWFELVLRAADLEWNAVHICKACASLPSEKKSEMMRMNHLNNQQRSVYQAVIF